MGVLKHPKHPPWLRHCLHASISSRCRHIQYVQTVNKNYIFGKRNAHFVPQISGSKVGCNGSRPKGTTLAAGSKVGCNGSRPKGTTLAAGSKVGCNGSRPKGTTLAAGSKVGCDDSRPKGTTLAAGSKVGCNGRRPEGTTEKAGYSVGHNGGKKLDGQTATFDDLIDLPNDWDCSDDTINLDSDLLGVCSSRISQQRRFDSKLLGIGVCHGCGHVLWTNIDVAHTFLVDAPPNCSKCDAPAAAYLWAVPNCSLDFVYTERGHSSKRRWYSRSSCRSNTVPTDQHIGNIFTQGPATPARAVKDWDMRLPAVVMALKLKNLYERGQVSLCGLFSTIVKDAGMSQFKHIQGEVNALHKLDRH